MFESLLLAGILSVLVGMYVDAKEYHKQGIKHMKIMEAGKDQLLADSLPRIQGALDKVGNLEVIPEIEQEN